MWPSPSQAQGPATNLEEKRREELLGVSIPAATHRKCKLSSRQHGIKARFDGGAGGEGAGVAAGG